MIAYRPQFTYTGSLNFTDLHVFFDKFRLRK